jgi:hypothetical protein
MKFFTWHVCSKKQRSDKKKHIFLLISKNFITSGSQSRNVTKISYHFDQNVLLDLFSSVTIIFSVIVKNDPFNGVIYWHKHVCTITILP